MLLATSSVFLEPGKAAIVVPFKTIDCGRLRTQSITSPEQRDMVDLQVNVPLIFFPGVQITTVHFFGH